MRAVTVRPPKPGVTLEVVPEPLVVDGQLKVRVLECGICGTDRDIVEGKYGRAPAGSDALILGHENLGRVEVVGDGVDGWSPGDLAVATVRRGCGRCRFCNSNRSDFCESGAFTERGISGRDGYLADAYVDVPEYLVRVPPEHRGVAVLLEPLSVVEKALDEGQSVLGRREPTRDPPQEPFRALVAGAGAIGVLAAFRLRADGYEVSVIDRHGETTPAAALLHEIGARHVNVSDGLGPLAGAAVDMIVEATGSAPLDFDLLPALGPNGVLVLTGIPAADAPPFLVPGGTVLRRLVLNNQAIVGSVNANRAYFEQGLADLARFRTSFGGALDHLVTARRPVEEYASALSDREPGSIKTVLTFSS